MTDKILSLLCRNCRRNVANVIIGILHVGINYLIYTEYLDKVNCNCTIFQLFDKSMYILWPNYVNHGDALLFVSDAAPYMKGRIQALQPTTLHVTFLAYALHNECEEVREHFPKVDRLITKMKKTFLKYPKRIAILKET